MSHNGMISIKLQRFVSTPW